jgi:iron complex outermembrane recepter protein
MHNSRLNRIFFLFRNSIFPIRHVSGVSTSSLCQKILKMKKLALIIAMIVGIDAVAQSELNIANQAMAIQNEISSGVISGQMKTTDGQPAAFVSIYIKENNRTAITDEQGNFTIRNLKEGTYTLEVTMVGLQPQQKKVLVKNDAISNISLVLFEDEKQLTEVVIATGRRLNNKPVEIGKVDISPMDLPQSLTIVGQGLIRDQQAQKLGDVVKNINGVYVTTTRGSVQESFGARGYSFGNYNLFKNGSRVNSGVMPEMSSIDRVEVLKGSAAILFGQVAPGGILNMVTKQPKFNFGGEVSMRLGSYNLHKPSFDIYGPVSSSIAYRLNGTFETAGSFRDNVSSKKYYVNPSLFFKLGKKTELLAEGDYLYNEFTPDFGVGTLDGTKIPDVPRSRFLGTGWQYNKTQQTTTNLSLRHQFNDEWKINSTFAYQYYKRDYFSVERVQADANGKWGRPLGKILTDEKYYTGQVNLVGKFKTSSMEHTLLSGVDADRYFTSNNDYSFPAMMGFPSGTYDTINILQPGKYAERNDVPLATNIRKREAPVNRFGAYVQDLIKLSSRFNVLVGARWSYVQTKGVDTTIIATGAHKIGSNRYDKAFSPRFGMVYKPFETTSFFASYSNSFVSNSTSWDIDGKPLEPSFIDQYELGVKNELFNGLLSANFTAYRIVNNNLAQTAPFLKDGRENTNTSIKQLVGQTTSDGFEIDFASHPVRGLDITAGYSYNYMRYTKTDTSAGSFKEGERLVNNPLHTANGTLFYTFGKGVLRGLKVGMTVVYTGDRFAGWNTDVVKKTNSQGQIIAPFTYRSRIFAVDGYTTIDLSAGYSYKKVSVMAKVSNLTNTLNYYVHENYSVNPVAPTQFIATVSYKF